MLISISKFLEGETMQTREEARRVQKKIEEFLQKKNDNCVLLDFSGITFVSRSFADEFRAIKLKLEKKGIKLELINMCDNVKRMFEVVERAAKKPVIRKENYENIEVIEIQL